jgi:3-oxoacyl-[acyl-carrier-protein] synthase-3
VDGESAVGILGTGSAVPQQILTNADLEKIVETSDEWIRTRTGILERRICEPGVASSDLAAEAARKALEAADTAPSQIGLLICATVTPDTYCPAAACYVQAKLGIESCIAYDINAACTGFIYGLSIARASILTGACEKALVIGVELLSRVTDYQDRATCVLFGDGAGAAVVGRVAPGKGLIAEHIAADGRLTHLISIPAGGSKTPASAESVVQRQHFLRMNGNEVFKVAVRILADSVEQAVKRGGLAVDDINLVIPHQANIRIIDAAARKLGLPIEKFYVNIHKYGNTSAASVPIALDEAVREGRVKSGDIVALVAFGAGFTWGASILRW